MLPHITPEQAARFWLKVKRSGPDECWEWQGKRLPKGYGKWYHQVNYKITDLLAHRVAFFLTYGAIPENRLICHHCDNPPCCNPLHLYAGTRSDNMCDAYARGQLSGFRGPRYYGDDHPNRKHPERMARKLTEQQVIEIRARFAAGETQTALASEYPVDQTNISAIIRRQTWRHVP